MAKLRHISIENTATAHPYIYPYDVKSKKFDRPPRDRNLHAQMLQGQLQDVVRDATVQHNGVTPDEYSITLEFRSDEGFALHSDLLQNLASKIQLGSVHEEDGIQVAIVHVPPQKISTFIKKIERYATKLTPKKGNYQNAPLVESIGKIRLAVVRSFWTDRVDLFPVDNQRIWWEVWLDAPRGESGIEVEHEFYARAKLLGIRFSNRITHFSECAVILAWCAADDWGRDPDLLNFVNEFRKAKEIPTPYVNMSARDQEESIDELLSRSTPPADNAPAVCLLDTGVQWGHPLLSLAMDENSAMSVDPNWLAADHNGHGTEMAGLALYGCLTRQFPSNEPVILTNWLESVNPGILSAQVAPISWGFVVSCLLRA